VLPIGDPAAQVNDFQPLIDQLADFSASIRERRAPMSTVAQVSKSIGFIQRCYTVAQPYPMEWINPIGLPTF
jgi:hypothetical protein